MAYVGPARRWQAVYCNSHWNTVGYPLLSSRYDYMVRDIFVEATLTETYQAQTNQERDVSYVFEVPPESSVVRFSARVGDTQIEAIVDEKGEANKKYQQATSAGVEAWKLDKVNEEVFQISLGSIKPDSTIIIYVTYVYVISSDTIEDSVRLTIPAGLAARPGVGPASETTVPTAPAGKNAVVITVGIQVEQTAQIFGLNSISHHANITSGFADDSFKKLSPVQRQQSWKQWMSYVEFTSDQFLRDHFVLVWQVPRIDHARCITEPLSPSISGQPETFACALTLVSNIELDAAEHEYIFLVDKSGSMLGSRIQTANGILKEMLNRLPTERRSTFNIYYFNTSAASVLDGGRSVGYDKDNVANALNRLTTNAGGGTDINNALTNVLSKRDASKLRCSVIIVTDGLDWGVTAAMQTVQKHVSTAAAQSKLLRVFVMGLGDNVSRGMCEALARAGSGATAYISESLLQDHDHQIEKAQTMINTINRAPIRVRSIDWGMTLNSTQSSGASGNNLDSRTQPDQASLGPPAKGENLPPPKAIQQAPLPGTMFWAIRSSWYAIINGKPRDMRARIAYDLPGSANSTKEIEVDLNQKDAGRLIHCLAARALIQGLEDKAVNMTNVEDKYWNECEVVRLGKTYSLASTQTSFIATRNGVGTQTNVRSNASIVNRTLLAGVPIDNTSGLNFVGTKTPPQTPTTAPGLRLYAAAPRSFAAAKMTTFAVSHSARSAPASEPVARGNDLSDILAAQEGDGSFNPSTVEQIIFPGTGIPEVAVFISTLEGRDNIKSQIWHAVCVIAFLQKEHGGRSSEWLNARSKAEKFVKTNLCCIFGVEPDQSEAIFANSLDDATGYFH